MRQFPPTRRLRVNMSEKCSRCRRVNRPSSRLTRCVLGGQPPLDMADDRKCIGHFGDFVEHWYACRGGFGTIVSLRYVELWRAVAAQCKSEVRHTLPFLL